MKKGAKAAIAVALVLVVVFLVYLALKQAGLVFTNADETFMFNNGSRRVFVYAKKRGYRIFLENVNGCKTYGRTHRIKKLGMIDLDHHKWPSTPHKFIFVKCDKVARGYRTVKFNLKQLARIQDNWLGERKSLRIRILCGKTPSVTFQKRDGTIYGPVITGRKNTNVNAASQCGASSAIGRVESNLTKAAMVPLLPGVWLSVLG